MQATNKQCCAIIEVRVRGPSKVVWLSFALNLSPPMLSKSPGLPKHLPANHVSGKGGRELASYRNLGGDILGESPRAISGRIHWLAFSEEF